MLRRLFAIGIGVISHVIFLFAVGYMILQLHEGMRFGHTSLSGWHAFAFDLLLLIQFPLIHSFFLTQHGRSILAKPFGPSLGNRISTTVFAIITSVQIFIVFYFWAPSTTLWLNPIGLNRVMMEFLYACSWVFLMKAMYDAGLGTQLGYAGWIAEFQNREPAYPPLPTKGTFQFIRHPVYLAFALCLWLGPVWTPDHLMVALVWGSYCILAPLLKERRYRSRYGLPFDEYCQKTPYMIPAKFVVLTATQ